jgi:anti-sigma B factor antagonist
MSAATQVRPLHLSGELTIQTVAEQKTLFTAFLDAPDADRTDVDLDLSDITELDTAGVQLLLMLKREVDLRGGRLHLTSPSRAVVDVLAIAHLNDHLEPVSSPDPAEVAR